MIEIEEHGSMRELRMARPPVNALNAEMVCALRDALAAAKRDKVDGVVLSGRPGMFSAGLDLKDLLHLSRPEMAKFWRDFFALMQDLARNPSPLVAAITGHSPAGGAVLALFCDRRVAADGPFKMGLNEVQVGLVVPWPIQAAFVRLLGARRAEPLLVRGALLSPHEALEVGFVDEVVATEAVVGRAIQWLEDLGTLPREAMLETRRQLRAQLAEPFERVSEDEFSLMLDQWFAASTQKNLRAVLERLAKRSG